MPRIRECPLQCGGTLVHDYQLGCMICDECATVPQGGWGLEEDENTAWHEGTTGIDLDNEQGGHNDGTAGGGGRGGGGTGRSKGSPLEQYQKKVMKVIYDLLTAASVPGSITATALHYMTEYSAWTHAMNLSNKDPPILAGACFQLACTKWKHPIQTHEIVQLLKNLAGEAAPTSPNQQQQKKQVKPAFIVDMRQQLIETLELADEVRQQQTTLFPNLATMYLNRLQIAKDPYPEFVACMAKNLGEVTQDSTLSASVCVAVSIYMALCSKAVAKELSRVLTEEARKSKNEAAATAAATAGGGGVDTSSSTVIPTSAVSIEVKPKLQDEAKVFLTRIAAVTHEAEASIYAPLRKMAKNTPHVEELLARFAAARKMEKEEEEAKVAASSNAEGASGRGKRNRDGEDEEE